MTDKAISELAAASSAASDDLLVMVDTSGGVTKKITASAFRRKATTLRIDSDDIGAVSLAPSPGTYDVDASAGFKQVNVANDETISVIHLHTQKGGTGVDIAFDIFRYRPSGGTHTYLGALSLSGTVSDDDVDSLVPAGALANVLDGDYIKAQATALTLGGCDGLTLDVHFAAY